MARARVSEPFETEGEGESMVERRRVTFFGAGVTGVDATNIRVVIPESVTTIEGYYDLIEDAVMAEAAALGYPMARNRIVMAAVRRGN